MTMQTIQDRAVGAIMGAFVGDALGLGPHWYYDLAELRRDYGEMISGYTDPKSTVFSEGHQDQPQAILYNPYKKVELQEALAKVIEGM